MCSFTRNGWIWPNLFLRKSNCLCFYLTTILDGLFFFFFWILRCLFLYFTKYLCNQILMLLGLLMWVTINKRRCGYKSMRPEPNISLFFFLIILILFINEQNFNVFSWNLQCSPFILYHIWKMYKCFEISYIIFPM